MSDGDIDSNEASSDYSVSDLFDETGEDPDYNPEEDHQQRPLFVNLILQRNQDRRLGRPSLGLTSNDDHAVSGHHNPSTRSPPLNWPRPSRQVISDSSSSDDEDNDSIDIWQSVNEGDYNYVHSFDNHETPGPKHCPPTTALTY